ncbi:MAG TPA: hypothetical protein VI462_06350 [Acidimicrobiia bacterium]
MRRRGLWRVVGIGTLMVTAYALWRVVESSRALDDSEPAARPTLEPPRAALRVVAPASRPVPAAPAWVDPDGRSCPITHPVKAKLRSGIFHLPGGASYERTIPDRCYADPTAAAADGLRVSRR